MNTNKCFLQFVPVSSFVQSSFWNKFTEIKINVDRLQEAEKDIWGYFSNGASSWATHVLEVDSTSFNKDFDCQDSRIPFHGKLFNKNTIEQFKDCDKTDLINREGKRFLDNITNGTALENPSLLNVFLILSFSDLKKYHFYYWFAFPVPHNLQLTVNQITPFSEVLSETQLTALSENYQKLDDQQKAYFLIHNLEIHTLKSKLKKVSDINHETYYFCFSDCLISNGNNPKPQFKNFILLILHYCPCLSGKSVNFLLFTLDKKLSCSRSLIFNVTLPTISTKIEDFVYSSGNNVWAGWEKNEKGKFGPRFSNMKATMDPKTLFEESVDLNLKLMKWRILPDIDLDTIKTMKCLLLGAGTLGCSVARTLLGWGVRNISFVDNSTVSFSNPVRQSLFTYEDSVQAKSKAAAAAENLQKIFPGINARAFQFTIPMPGHSVGENTIDSVKESVENLIELIKDHDVIFLLTDSRESRWLPTLLGVFHEKIVINVALGFDSYLIMRYGGQKVQDFANQSEITNAEGSFKKIHGSALGCYFCNDVTAPGNSLKDRTLDQQCTVTRPGVSLIAGALAVELTIGITQHPDGMQAAAFYTSNPQQSFDEIAFSEDQSILGLLPHSIRGFLSTFTHVLPATPKYNQCIACSEIVLQEYASKGFEFLLESFNSRKYLEDLTGLSELQNQHGFDDAVVYSFSSRKQSQLQRKDALNKHYFLASTNIFLQDLPNTTEYFCLIFGYSARRFAEYSVFGVWPNILFVVLEISDEDDWEG